VIFWTEFGLRFFYTNPSQILESLTDFCVDFLFTQMLAELNIYTSVEQLHRCRCYTTQRYDSYHRRISSNIAARGGLLGQGSVDGVVGSGTIGGVGVTTGSGRTDKNKNNVNFDKKMMRMISAKKLATRSSTTRRNACRPSLRA
jgi:hypothetical protein